MEKDAVASGASGRSSALVRMHYTNEWDARLAWASFPVFRHWSELIGGPPVFTHTGFVNAVAPAYAEHLRKNVEMLRGIGINTQAITAAELKDLQPFANVDDVGAAAYEPDSGYANPAETVEGFRRRAEELGGGSCSGRRSRRSTGGTARCWASRRARAHRRGRVVLAAGAWSPRICRELGIDLHARPKAIDTVAVTRPAELPTHMVFIDNVQGNYFRTEAGGLTLVGVPCQEWDIDPDTLGSGLPPHAAGLGAQLLTHRIPAMERATLARGYRAFDGYSRDRHAILGARRRRRRPLSRDGVQRLRLQDRPGGRHVHGRADHRGPRQDGGHRRLQPPPLRRGQDGGGTVSLRDAPGPQRSGGEPDAVTWTTARPPAARPASSSTPSRWSAAAARTGRLGVGTATRSLAVGARVPHVRAGLGAVAIMAIADARLGQMALRLLELGYKAPAVVEELVRADPYAEYRQLGVIDGDGFAAARTGQQEPGVGRAARARRLHRARQLPDRRAHPRGDGARVHRASRTRTWRSACCAASRRAATRAASTAASSPRPCWSTRTGSFAHVDLRVDVHPEPVGELRRVFDAYRPAIPYYNLRQVDARVPPLPDWLRDRPR